MYKHGRNPPAKREFKYRDSEHVETDPTLPSEEYLPLCDNERLDHILHQDFVDAGYIKFLAGWAQLRTVYSAAVSNTESKRIIDSLGWDGLWEIRPGNSALMMIESVMRYWWDTTNSFLLPNLELGLTPLDFTFLTGIPCGVGTEPPYDSKWDREYDQVISIYFPYMETRISGCRSSRSNGIDNSKLKRYLLAASQDSTTGVAEGREMARAFMMWLIGQVFFPNSSSIARSGWIEALADMERVKDYDWGSAILARLYHSLGESSRCVPPFEGFHMIIEFWLYAYFATLVPDLKVKVGVQDKFPRIKAYDKDAMSNKQKDTGRRSFAQADQQLQWRNSTCTIWQPYVNSIYYHLPQVQVALEYSSKRVILFDPEKGVGTWYLGDRFWRQLYGVPTIPANPPPRDNLSYVPLQAYYALKQKGWQHADLYTIKVYDDKKLTKWWKRVNNAPKQTTWQRRKNKEVRGPIDDESLQLPTVELGEVWTQFPDPPTSIDMSSYCQWTIDLYDGEGQVYSRPVTSIEQPTSYEPEKHSRDQWAKIAGNLHDLNTMIKRMALEDSRRYYQSNLEKDRENMRLRSELANLRSIYADSGNTAITPCSETQQDPGAAHPSPRRSARRLQCIRRSRS